MKRLWIGLGLLGVMLLSGLWVTRYLHKTHDPGAAQLRRASDCAVAGNWEEAEELTEKARKQWEKSWNLTAAIYDHDVMDDIDVRFAMLDVFARGRDAVGYGAVCADLAELMEGLGKAHALSWWNLL